LKEGVSDFVCSLLYSTVTYERFWIKVENFLLEISMHVPEFQGIKHKILEMKEFKLKHLKFSKFKIL